MKKVEQQKLNSKDVKKRFESNYLNSEQKNVFNHLSSDPLFLKKDIPVNYQFAKVYTWNDSKFEWDKRVEEGLRTLGIQKFRNNQKAIINCTMSKKDVLAIMPTGGGKSLTFQLPAKICQGISIVIMPLISLIHDQCGQMQTLNIKANKLTGQINQQEQQEIMKNCFNQGSNPKVLFMTPEKLGQSDQIKSFLLKLHSLNMIDRFVIDEAHCVSQWGNDFRSDYLNLGILRDNYPGVPILALTATATEKVKVDIIKLLKMDYPYYFQCSFNRPNLIYEVREIDKKKIFEDMNKFINENYKNQSGIIYCCTQKDCESVCSELITQFKLKAGFYHGGMNDKEKTLIQNRWMEDDIQIIVATIAFGMGINKSDVRFVFHYCFSKSVENYYQESGRAGRDSKRAHCIIYYNQSDKEKISYLINNNQNNSNLNKSENQHQLNQMIKYCEDKVTCRRQFQLNYLGEQFESKKCNKSCDNCIQKKKYNLLNCKEEAIKIQDYVYHCRHELTTKQLIQALRGNKIQIKNKQACSQIENSDIYGYLRSWKKEKVEQIVKTLLQENLMWEQSKNQVINQVNYSYMLVKVTKMQQQQLKNLQEFNIKQLVEDKEEQPLEEDIDSQYVYKPIQKKQKSIIPEDKPQEFEQIIEPIESLENYIYKGKKIDSNSNDSTDEKSRCVYDPKYGYCQTQNIYEQMQDILKKCRKQIFQKIKDSSQSDNQQIEQLLPQIAIDQISKNLPLNEQELKNQIAEGLQFQLQQYFYIILNKIQDFCNLHEINKSEFIKYEDSDKDKEDEVYNIEDKQIQLQQEFNYDNFEQGNIQADSYLSPPKEESDESDIDEIFELIKQKEQELIQKKQSQIDQIQQNNQNSQFAKKKKDSIDFNSEEYILKKYIN